MREAADRIELDGGSSLGLDSGRGHEKDLE